MISHFYLIMISILLEFQKLFVMSLIKETVIVGVSILCPLSHRLSFQKNALQPTLFVSNIHLDILTCCFELAVLNNTTKKFEKTTKIL